MRDYDDLKLTGGLSLLFITTFSQSGYILKIDYESTGLIIF